MKVDLLEIRRKTVEARHYINNISQPFREKFLEQEKAYSLDPSFLAELKKFAKNYVVVAFSAEWCKDCAANIPVLALLSEKTGLEVRVFGGLKRDPLNPARKWSIPPSPQEVETFHVDKIPYILIFNSQGEKIGEIVENPKEGLTLEREILQIIQAHLSQPS